MPHTEAGWHCLTLVGSVVAADRHLCFQKMGEGLLAGFPDRELL